MPPLTVPDKEENMAYPLTHIGPGALSRLGDVLDGFGTPSIFLVADADAYRLSGAEAVAAPALQGRRLVRFDGFAANPRLVDAEKGLALFRRAPCDTLLAIGGGSAIDMAKLVGALAANDGPPAELATGKRPMHRHSPPLVAVPTTAGTGSEATHFAVVYVGGKKYSLAHPGLLPHTVLIDPLLTATLPTALTAHTGLDALCQAIESLWSVNADAVSLADARQALYLALRHLNAACLEPTPAARLGMCRAAHLAGRAINRSKTTAPHALSYSLTSGYGVPHGLAVALTLGAVLEYNAGVSPHDSTDPRGPEWTRYRLREICAALGAADAAQARRAFTQRLQALGCPTRLGQVGVDTPAQLEELARTVNAERLGNNPRRLDADSLVRLLATLA